MSYPNPYVELAHAYLNAVQSLDADGLSKLIAHDAKAQFLPSASLGPLAEPKDKAEFLSIIKDLGRKIMKDARLPMEIIEVTDASAAGLIIAHTKAKGAYTAAGKPFTNEYLIMLWMDEVDDQLKITRIQEFLDSAFVQTLGL
ncbi:hypothetical protein EXIGLDRAFT_746009 [Exidia glandulosa HHB12029]|uniref:SnoaL-like domain-containing protein n=1 Tax=Exidia glandulosa HHB12029 TaxID=1314781 RepID=A0A165MU45_EXIGL|nr:hypothetical protein EXIGLDRAFT_746009 [Exidia glandulosa HHB12029]